MVGRLRKVLNEDEAYDLPGWSPRLACEQDEGPRRASGSDHTHAGEDSRTSSQGPDGQNLPTDAHVFGDEVGHQIARRRLCSMWLDVCERAKVKNLHLHDLRAEGGSQLLESGVPMHIVRDALGHSSVHTTNTYLRGRSDAGRRLQATTRGAGEETHESGPRGPIKEADQIVVSDCRGRGSNPHAPCGTQDFKSYGLSRPCHFYWSKSL